MCEALLMLINIWMQNQLLSGAALQEQVSYKTEKQEYGVELADAHCHLELFEDYKIAISDARMAGVKTIITAGGSMAGSLAAVDIADGKSVFAVIGIDPAFSGKDSSFISQISKIINSEKKVVGIGEVGLDYKLPDFDKKVQKKVFIEQIDIAKKLDMPLVIHARGAIDDAISVVEEQKVKKAMFHFFEGNEAQAVHLAGLGYMISIPPIESARRRRIINALGLNSIVVETDSPVVGKNPIDVIKTVGWIAQIKGLNFEDAATRITQNVKKLFSI